MLFTQTHIVGYLMANPYIYIYIYICISHSTNILGKGLNSIILPLAMGK